MVMALMFATVLIAGGDWAVLADEPDWQVLAFEPADATAWTILPPAGVEPLPGTAPAPARAATGPCAQDCGCDNCRCKPGESCPRYAEIEAKALRDGKRVIVAIGVDRAMRDAAQREAKQRGLLFFSAATLAGMNQQGQREAFPVGMHELAPLDGSLVFVERVKPQTAVTRKLADACLD